MTTLTYRHFRPVCCAFALAAVVVALSRCSDPAIPPPLLQPMDDTTVAVCDTVTLRVAAEGEAVAHYTWSVPFADSVALYRTVQPLLQVYWSARDTGRHTIDITAVGRNGERSPVASFRVRVKLYAPTVTAPRDTSVAVRDTLAVCAQAYDSNGVVRLYEWIIGSARVVRTSQPCLSYAWPSSDTGLHRITVRVRDDDSIWSAPDTFFVTVRLFPPVVAPLRDTSVAIHDTLVLRAPATDSNGTVVRWYWEMGDTIRETQTDSIALRFGRTDTGAHELRVRVMDDDSVLSAFQRCTIWVQLLPPVISPLRDTVVAINDTLVLRAPASDSNGTVVRWYWEIGDTVRETHTDSIAFRFARADTGMHELRVRVMDDDSVMSATDTMSVSVMLFAPRVAFVGDTVYTAINDTVVLRAVGNDTNGVIVRYEWRGLPGQAVVETEIDSLMIRWGRSDTGWQTVVVSVLDDDTVNSPPDTARVYVALLPPRISPVRDTLLRASDTLAFTVDARDSNGPIVRYYFDLGDDGWDDSSTSPSVTVPPGIADTITVIVGALDDDTTMALDTFRVAWNYAPDSLTVTRPADTMRVWGSESNTTDWRVPFWTYVSDRNEPFDTVYVRLLIYSDTNSVADTVYEGTGRFLSFDRPEGGVYRWRVEAYDMHGEAVADSGQFVCIRERRVCFAGHSLVTGYGGDTMHGGFRKNIFDSLAQRMGPFERLRTMGPMLTGCLQPPELDSCLARSGAQAREIYDSLYYHDWINADWWVMMLGVNGRFGYYEQLYSRRLIDSALFRNPSTEVYFLNGLPFPDTVTLEEYFIPNREVFNAMLETVADTRRSYGYNVEIIDAFNVMSIDSVFNDSLFVDYLHPNQLGYDRLAEAVLDKMFKR